jgi:hypothetical protein
MSDGQTRMTCRLETGKAATSGVVVGTTHPLRIMRHGGLGRRRRFGQRRGSLLAGKKVGTVVVEEREEDGGIAVVEGNRGWNPMWSRAK